MKPRCLQPNASAILMAFLIAASGAHAQGEPTKLALAEQLAKLLQMESMFKDDHAACLKPQKDSPTDPEAAYRANPEYFEGLSPKSASWSEVQAIYGRFQAKVCESYAPEKMVRYFAEELAARASEEDLKASIAFYSSAPGARLQRIAVGINKDLQAHLADLQLDGYKVAREQFKREIQAVIAKHRAEQK